MRMISKIVEQINEEIEGAEGYFCCAKEYKEEHPEVSRKYYELAQQELMHVDTLHKIVVDTIEMQRRNGVEIPKEMMIIWDWEHKKYIEEVEELKYKMSLFNK